MDSLGIPVHPDVQAILERVKQTADFGYVDFSDINATNELGDNALHCVIVWGGYEAARILVAHGINVNQKGEEGYTPLHVACSHGHKDIVRLLLECGADAFVRARQAICRLRRLDWVGMMTFANCFETTHQKAATHTYGCTTSTLKH